MPEAPIFNGEQKESQETEVIRGGRDKWGRFAPGYAGGPGRPVGSTSLKTFAQEFLKGLSPEDKVAYLRLVDPQEVWRMAEGNPHSTEDVKHTIAPTPIMSIVNVDSTTLALPDGESPTASLESPKTEG